MRFFLDQDVPEDVARVLRHWQHDVVRLRDMLSITTSDAEVFNYARAQGFIMVTCNRDDFSALASSSAEHAGVIILIRRRSRQAECSALLDLLRRTGEGGLASNINFA